MNRLIMMGRLCADPEIRYGGADNHTAVANFRIAVDRRFKRDGDPNADFFRITAIGKTAEFVDKYLRKGTKIVLEGEIRNNNYTGKDGNMVYSDQIIANSIEFAERKSTSTQQNNANDPVPMPEDATKEGGFMYIPDDIGDELPFS